MALLKRAYRAVVGPPAQDLVHAWPGTATDALPTIRHLHIGDCNFRRMDFAHDFSAPPGYPLAAADVLLEHGIGVAFAHYFCIRFEHLPEPEDVPRRIRLAWTPDIVTIQMGGNYTRWIVIPDTRRTMQLRVELGRRIGRYGSVAYRVIQPFVYLLGRPPARYCGTGAFEQFLLGLRRMWPDAQLVVVPPMPRCWRTRRQRRIGAQVDGDMRAVADRCGATILDAPKLLGRDRTLRGASRYQLNGRGCEVIGKALAEQMLTRAPLPTLIPCPPRPTPAKSVSASSAEESAISPASRACSTPPSTSPA